MNRKQGKGATRSRMTNGPVAGPATRMTNGRVSTRSGASPLSVKYRGGMQTISFPRDESVTALTATADKLKPGDNVFVLAKTQKDGSFITTSVVFIPGSAN